MSRPSSLVRSSRPPQVLVFAENRHDSDSLCEIVRMRRPDLDRKVSARRRPVSLTRGADVKAVRNWVAEIADVVAATTRGGQSVSAVIVHRDADVVDLSDAEEKRLLAQIDKSMPRAVAAVPVVTIESWWLLHPDATESIRPQAWRNLLPRRARTTDAIADPKSELRHLTGQSRMEYTEGDSPRIAAAIKHHPAQAGSSPSFDRFVAAIAKLPR